MTNKKLSHYFSLQRRYSRSINLERDLDSVEALEGYVLTKRAIDSLKRIVNSFNSDEGNRAWTLTSVYGTGKSAFAHYLISLAANSQSQIHLKALSIAENKLGKDSDIYQLIEEKIHPTGLIRAVATGQREPISHTIIRALLTGINSFWTPSQRNKINTVRQLVDLEAEINEGGKLDSREIPNLVLALAAESQSGIFLVIDELGKNLEYAAHAQGDEDLYLLQQLAELPKNQKNPIYILGILHQAFAEYGQRLATIQKNEWAKIQGRFEDISFTESSGQMMSLIGEAINSSLRETSSTAADNIRIATHTYALEWFENLESMLADEEVTEQIIQKVYPLHPLSALVLPSLCQKYAQNDRSLFTFLTSSEPLSFRNFLETVTLKNHEWPCLKLYQVYDYFIESAGMGLASRPNLQRWVEVQDLINDAKRLEEDSLRVLKTIGVLNLITVTGSMRATRTLVSLAMCNIPSAAEINYWQEIIDKLLKQNLITHRRQLDELRIWQGSDFNVDSELSIYIEQERSPLVKLLSIHRPLKPLVAQRHSYQTGTLRYFERHYLDKSQDLSKLSCNSLDADGFVGYWVDEELPISVPSTTSNGKPLVILSAANLDILRIRTLEFVALNNIKKTAKELQTDGVARKEVNYRLQEAEEFLDETLNQSFSIGGNQQCWIQGQVEKLNNISDFNSKLSEICDRVYHRSPILWNELINRRDLTSQGAKARRELIQAMLEHQNEEKLGLEGYGPEVSMYYSLLEETGIHRQEEGYWDFYPPSENSGLNSLWEAVEDFCLAATEKSQTFDLLYQHLATPPFGVKQGAVPVILAAVLLHHADDLGLYQDGTFIPVLGTEHFELLVKYPERFAVKYFAVVGLRAEVFKELEAILRNPQLKKLGKVRNATLLTVVTPLYQFVKKLPKYTQQTRNLAAEPRAILKALQTTVEPDELLFKALPAACNLPSIGIETGDDGVTAKTLRTKLVHALREIHTAYDRLLSDCQKLIYEAFGVRSQETKLREDLRVRANYLAGKCIEPLLKRFIRAASDESKSDSQWLEALVMIVADKPAESWTDDDATAFEMKLADLVRRFKNLEALQKEVAAKGEGFEARRITMTRPDGQEIHQMVWVDHGRESQVEKIVDKILAELPDDQQLRQAILAKLSERILNPDVGEGVKKIEEKRSDEMNKKKLG
ncbi:MULTISPECIES: hypothetical protein [unclassified Tolypothrix]|uniref:hypothetical protein n=1 Tax=unclassified Tolypothrix TaxID=2649714 RepID=UPI0005F850E3|nr:MULTISPECIES: hypothetical protein [unclassified Tolypothrix]MBE9086737.1 hypothetical protein [Tolypothrix sp. LEGE 11397]UYD28618.1 hypothetical protein HGR01_11620 [Tolypothrix sp. PCC 7712]UYD35473.1 hypothetical protein HG267_06755 [Tolypothrix sp. PCC 7601]BAY94983.1 hypothetical protein NIES3275_70390 [Microchaete diplosiphon NIES-3275]